jgi:hypothetical protein
MPSISEGFHAKMSLFVRRKSMSALSYLGRRFEPMRSTLPSEPVGSTRISLVFSVGSKEHASNLASGTSSTVAALVAASSLEAMVAALVSVLEGGADGDDCKVQIGYRGVNSLIKTSTRIT